MDKKDFDLLVAQVGKEAAEQIKKEMLAYEAKAKEVATQAVKDGGVTKEAFEAFQLTSKESLQKVEEICKTQGTTINELAEKLTTGKSAIKSIAEVLEENREELKKVYLQGSGTKQFHVTMNAKGEYVMSPYDATKVGPQATISGIGGGAASVVQSMDAASLLRMGGNAPIIGNFRNTPWVFDLVNLINASMDQPFAIWYEETAKVGTSATVLEGGTKPGVVYAYELKTAPWKKEAQIIGVTEEFNMDFPRLQSDILGKGKIDVINRMNTAILADITSNATLYNTGSQFNSGEDAMLYVNDFDAIAAMAAQVDNATYGGNMANAAVMSTFKKYRMGVTKSSTGEYLNRPDVLSNIAFVGNPAMGASDIMVGDFKNFNVILRGGFIIKIGYNGTDFAENRFSIVMEQFYMDYISTLRKVGIVKGPNFSTVKGYIDNAGS